MSRAGVGRHALDGSPVRQPRRVHRDGRVRVLLHRCGHERHVPAGLAVSMRTAARPLTRCHRALAHLHHRHKPLVHHSCKYRHLDVLAADARNTNE